MSKKTHPSREKLTPHEKNSPTHSLPIISNGTTKYQVLVCVSEGGNPHSIANKLHLDKSGIVQHLKSLQKLGFVDKEWKLGSWLITNKGKDFLKGGENFSQDTSARGVSWINDRAHDLKIIVKILEKPLENSWYESWTPYNLKNNVFYKNKFGDIWTTYTGKSLIFQLPVLRFKDSNIALAEAGKIARALIRKYEDENKGLKLNEPDIKIRVLTQSHAIPNEPFAKWLRSNGIAYKDEKIEVDSSESPELEFTDPKESGNHFERYVKQIKGFIEEDCPTVPELTKILNENQKQLTALIQSQIATTQQLQTVIKLTLSQGPKSPESELKSNEKPFYVG